MLKLIKYKKDLNDDCLMNSFSPVSAKCKRIQHELVVKRIISIKYITEVILEAVMNLPAQKNGVGLSPEMNQDIYLY